MGWLSEKRERRRRISRKNEGRKRRMSETAEEAGKKEKKHGGRSQRWLILLPAAATVMTLIFVFFVFSGGPDRRAVIVESEVYYEREDLTTILLLGIDQRDTLENETGKAGDNGQADMIWLVMADRDTGDVKVITIPRETMVEVEEYHASGAYAETTRRQICLQYAYGRNSTEGCELTERAVKRLLENVPVDYTCAVSMGAITRLVDAAGGVDVAMTNTYSVPNEDYSAFVTYEAGTTAHMDGEEAYRFVHYRDIQHLYTNLDRMDRQQDFLTAFADALKDLIRQHPLEIPGLFRELEPYYTTDLTLGELLRLAWVGLRMEVSDLQRIQIPGEEIHVGRYDQYETNDRVLRDLVLELFYEKET